MLDERGGDKSATLRGRGEMGDDAGCEAVQGVGRLGARVGRGRAGRRAPLPYTY